MSSAIYTLLFAGGIALIFSSLQIVGYFARDRAKWAVWGIMIFYWFLYLLGIFLIFVDGTECVDHLYCNLTSIGGLTLVGFGISAIAFYEVTVYSYTSLVRKLKKLGFSDQFTEKIRLQHTRAVIVFFFTTWVAAGFIYFIHHRASGIIKQALKDPENTDRETLEAELTVIFDRKVDWRKKKKVSTK